MNYTQLMISKYRQPSYIRHRSVTLTKTRSLNFSLLPVGSDVTSDPDNIPNRQLGFLAHRFLEFLHLFKHFKIAECAWTACKKKRADQALNTSASQQLYC